MRIINTVLKDEIYINWEERSSGINYPLFHSHNAYEIYILTAGSRTVFTGKDIYLLTSGDTFTVAPGILHRSFGDEAYSGLCIEFSQKCLENMFSDDERKKILSCFEYKIISLDTDAVSSIMQADKNKHDIVMLTVSFLLNSASNSNAVSRLTQNSDISPISLYLQNIFTQAANLDWIAAHFGITKEYLCSLFKSQTGMTIIEYINLLRIQHACTLLQETDLSSAEISARCGYGSPIYFNRVFKRIMEETPLAHRRRARESGMYSYEKNSL